MTTNRQKTAQAIYDSIEEDHIKTCIPEDMSPEEAISRLERWLGGDNRGPGKGFASPRGRDTLAAVSALASSMDLADVCTTYAPMLETNLATIDWSAEPAKSNKRMKEAKKSRFFQDIISGKIDSCGSLMIQLITTQLRTYAAPGKVPAGDNSFKDCFAHILQHTNAGSSIRRERLEHLVRPISEDEELGLRLKANYKLGGSKTKRGR